MCKPFTSEIVRDIPLNIKKSLTNIDKNDLIQLKESILEYCRQPRNLDEIKEFSKLDTTRDSIRNYLLRPLVKEGKLKYTNEFKFHHNQRYINAEIEVTKQMLDDINEKADTLTLERINKILEFCKQPRGIKEIEKHIETTNARQYVKQLVEQGKLNFTFPDIPSYLKQQYINAEIEYKAFTDQDVIDYCETPRTKAEIQNHFNLSIAMRKGVLQRLFNQGKIDYTEESKRLGKCDGNRRVVKNG